MQLLTDIISELTGSQPSLIDALVKTKVLLYRLGRKDLAEWVDHEINGYPDGAVLPSYRVVSAQVKGNITNQAYTYSDHPLPTMHLTEEQRKRLEELEMRDSIAVIEALAKQDTKGLSRPIPLELSSVFNKGFTGGYRVQQAWCDIGVGRLPQIVAQVRSKLLDFLLELSEKVGTGMSDDDAKRVAQSPETGSMFNNAIFGDNVTILVGENNRQQVAISVRANDFDALAKFLRAKGVAESDVEELRGALADDALAPEVREKKFGPRVRDWMSSMFKKAVDASWQVELGVVGGLLTSALQKYYGW